MSGKRYDRALVWFRRDLRDFDHAALHFALALVAKKPRLAREVHRDQLVVAHRFEPLKLGALRILGHRPPLMGQSDNPPCSRVA